MVSRSFLVELAAEVIGGLVLVIWALSYSVGVWPAIGIAIGLCLLLAGTTNFIEFNSKTR